jgi:flagellar basal body-associated protein FliL
MARTRSAKRIIWTILVVLVALGTIAYLALPFLGTY